ncbi:hypothetical protein [Bacillus sp. ISL-77]|uniref:hypothetical protein n=1 Tax=Bacillus sp. ISL-77 TaxID=2819138 RepID=UPI001BEBC972|nr:hypothetical protein [Bacillus sp. ISL-77]MBT2741946.1 hypothetical protein [Bacillus sp. ISL-77]
MFKFTVYRKVNMSRNFFLLMLVILLGLVSAKIVLAHEKIDTYNEAVKLFKSGELVAAEEKFHAAKLNVSVTDHNKDINFMLSILSPIREVMEDLDEKAADYNEGNDLDNLIKIYDRWKESEKKWVSGTNVQKDMYGEMVALTKLDTDMKGYFSTIKKENLDKLMNETANDISEEEEIFTVLNKIPAEYYGSRLSAKTEAIQSSFKNYYAAKINKMVETGTVSSIIDEGSRQFSALRILSLDSSWLEQTLDSNLLRIVTAAIDKKDYGAFTEAANSIKKLEANMNGADVFAYIEKTTSDLIVKAENLTEANKYEDAIRIYEALKPLKDTTESIASANLAWDKYEPIRVLKRLYPGKEFPNVINAKNKWGADSVVAAISTDGGIYFGKLTGEEAMVVTEGAIEGAASINKLAFNSNFSTSDNPVLYIEAKSSERKHHYIAYEVNGGSMVKILDVEADKLIFESEQVLVVDNPVGQGEGELAYFESDGSGEYQFSRIKVDYVDIQVTDIANYYGKKVRFTAFADTVQNGGALVTLSETYNNSTGLWEKTYLLLKGDSDFTIYENYTVIGTFNSYENITDENGESVRVPVFQVEKVE